MKTVAEFIQRLQDDPAFEKQAQAFEHGDDLVAFGKRQGYDFTLEQLMSEFERDEKLPAETGGPAPAPADVSPSPPLKPDEAEFPRQPDVLSSGESATSPLGTGHGGFTPEPPLERVPRSKEAMPPPEPEEEPRAGLFGSGGGRHRGFSPQRLKSISEEDT
ncbi:MAG: Nif11-like leader peptide family natural product precursor [Deltaproteobacteria bacterium]|nr:Nif11-like leader peptide family natural product precursor [Deltaproteobacteria bacterium]